MQRPYLQSPSRLHVVVVLVRHRREHNLRVEGPRLPEQLLDAARIAFRRNGGCAHVGGRVRCEQSALGRGNGGSLLAFELGVDGGDPRSRALVLVLVEKLREEVRGGAT